MDDREPGRFFQGNELPRMLLLLGVMLAGWVMVWRFAAAPKPAAEPETVVNGARPPEITPDPAIEFETVTDKTPLTFRDTAAYATLIDRARGETPQALAAKARRDVFYSHLWDRPGHYRGVPIHLRGTARRVLYYESKLSKTGWLHEVWLFTTGSRHPYVCVFEDAPKGLPVGEDVSELVEFDGYFLKLLRYQANDAPRAAALLIGKVGWTPHPADPGAANRPVYYLAAALAAMGLIALGRWLAYLRRLVAPPRRPSLLRDRPVEEIAPEALADWLETAAEPADDSQAAGPGCPLRTTDET